MRHPLKVDILPPGPHPLPKDHRLDGRRRKWPTTATSSVQLMFERSRGPQSSTDVVGRRDVGQYQLLTAIWHGPPTVTINASLPLRPSEFWWTVAHEPGPLGDAQQELQIPTKWRLATPNTLSETTSPSQSLQTPLSIPSPASLGKELVPYKTLGYSVLAHAQAMPTITDSRLVRIRPLDGHLCPPCWRGQCPRPRSPIPVDVRWQCHL